MLKASKLLLGLVAVLAGAVVVVSPVGALPTDPPITNVAPADGAAVPANAKGISVVYTCPNYTSIAELPNGGGRRDYIVQFAKSADLGSDGRFLRSNLVASAGPQYFQDNELPDGQCRGVFANSSNRVETTPGTYFWQVSRICTSCGGYEVGPVSSFAVTLTGSNSALTIAAPSKMYGGYASIVSVSATSIPNGAAINIEASGPAGWRSIGSGNLVSGIALIPVLTQVGDTALRATAGEGDGIVRSTETAVRVTKATKWPKTTVGSWVGFGAGSEPKSVSFRVTGGGATLTDGRFVVPMLCPSPGLNNPFTIQIGTALLPPTRIAPDGTFVYAGSPSVGLAVVATGTLTGRSSAGSVQMSLGGCTGTMKFTASRR